LKTFSALLLRDARRTSRAPTAVILLLLFPLALGAVFSLAFGGSGTPKVRLAIAMQDEGLLSQFISGAMDRPELRDRFEATVVDSAEGRSMLDRDKASALLVIPPGFTDRFLEGDSTTITVWKNARESILPQVVEEGALILADVLAAARVVLGEPLGEFRAFTQADRAPEPLEVGRVSTAIAERLRGAGRFLFPPIVGLERKSGTEGDSAARIFLLILPGFVVMTLVMIADFSMRDLLRDAARGTLALCLTAPVTAAQIVRAKIAFTVLLSLASLAILSAFGAGFVRQKIDLAAFVALSLAYSMAAAGFVALTYGMARSERQGAIVGSMVLLVMSFLGGSYIPLSALPAGMRALSPFTLNFWGVDGYLKILTQGNGLGGVAMNVIVLLIIFAVSTALGSALMTRRLARGSR
jgi:ABC-2 type transport system permease protein